MSGIKEYHAARYAYLWVSSTEEDRIMRDTRNKVKPEINILKWDIASGFSILMNPNGDKTQWVWKEEDPEIRDPGEALRAVIRSGGQNTIFFMMDYNKFFEDITVQRTAMSIKPELKESGVTVIFVAPEINIPPLLQDEITVVSFDYPDKDGLRTILKNICTDNNLPTPDDSEALVDAMTGLTVESAEDALACSLVTTKGKLDYQVILDIKAAKLKAGGLINYAKYKESFEDLYGLELMKSFTLRTIQSSMAGGILIYGVPGTGKSHFAKALANETKRPCLVANFNGLRGELQGQAESRTDNMLKIVEAFGNPIVFADEFDKSISGSSASSTDGGVGQRILGKFLAYMEDRKPGGAYWVCTVNSLEDILSLSGGALVRRFDCIFFVDMPTQAECRGIAKIWGEKFGVEIPSDFQFDGMTGADIKKLAKNMKMLFCDAQDAKEYIVTTQKALGDRINQIRKAAQSVCIWASKAQEESSTGRRRVSL
jgi:hypothetical protein